MQFASDLDSEAPLGSYGAVDQGRPQAAEVVAEEEAAEARAKPSLKDLPPLFTPWLLYSMLLVSTALMEGPALSILAVVTCAMITCAFIVFSRALPWRMLAMTCFVMSVVGYALGSYDKAKYLYPYYFYMRSPSYSGVDPNSGPGSVADAGFVTFSQNALVDTTRSVGYVSGSTWCVAPVVSSDASNYAGYWAVGKDCCRRQGLFQCGDATNETVRSGIVVQDASPILQDQIPQYQTAAEMAAETYGINMPRNPVFVRWNDTPDANTDWYWNNAVNFAVVASVLFLFVAPCFLAVMKCAGYSFFGRKAGPGWHPEKLELMTYGFDWPSSRVYPAYVQQDLLYSRSFWSGEVIQDYIFHIANRHIFLSIFFCHPVHPYMKWQRLAVALTTATVLLFSTAALTAWTGHTALRIAFIILVFLVLRNSLKLFLMSYGIEDSARELDQGHVVGGKNVRSINAREIGVVLAYALGAVLAAVGCSALISASHKDLGPTLSAGMDVLGYIYVLDFLFDLLTPFLGHDAFDGVWTLGFFGRWRRERDEFESAKAQLAQGGRNQWTSLGAEVLGVGTRRGQRKSQGPVVGEQYIIPRGVMTPTTESAPMFSQYAVKRGSRR
eukprot:gb/GFBE01043564.1/.p1 GENE.gb/GFBE01043564.1/~~gb/GFBE01043564.1/.p1  ORF type:complete len:611 (+),score=115.89 gb/GFBE01043564.1/:1-1833(+)